MLLKLEKIENMVCKNRNASQSIHLEWHVCPGDTSVRKLQMLEPFMLETGHEPECFQDKIIFASVFHDITNWEQTKL